jgi:CspA family cold shock protein
MPVGTVKFFNADKGYGFIAPDGGGDDSFVHISAVQAAGMHTLDKEQRVNFEVEVGRNGKASAINLSAAEKGCRKAALFLCRALMLSRTILPETTFYVSYTGSHDHSLGAA